MKKLFLSLVLLAILAPVALADKNAAAEILSAEVPTVEAVGSPSETVTAETLDGDGLPLAAVEIAIDDVTSAYECPPYTAYCQQDSQCDASCGPGAGACERGCCYCSS